MQKWLQVPVRTEKPHITVFPCGGVASPRRAASSMTDLTLAMIDRWSPWTGKTEEEHSQQPTWPAIPAADLTGYPWRQPDQLSLPLTWPTITAADLTGYPCRQPVPLSLRLCHKHLVIAGFLPFAFTLHEFAELIFQRAIFWSTQFPGPITAYSLPMGAFILKPHFLHVCFAAFQCHEMSFIFSKQFHCFLSLFTKVKICSHLTEREGL